MSAQKKSSSLVFPAVVIALFASIGWSDEPTATPKITSRDEIAILIAQLGASSFSEREEAEKKLIALGSVARDQLIQAKSSDSAEVRSRSASILKQIDKPPTAAEFKELASQPDTKLDLEHGLWLIARIVDPSINRRDLTKPLDELATRVRERLGKDVAPKEVDPKLVVAAVRGVLFEDAKFTGNTEDYENPDNSSIVRVLATRKGLPITLSHVVVAVGERLEVPFVGVPTPGRYIVKYDGRRAPKGFPRDDIFLNPFDEGKVLSREDREQLFPGLDPDDFPEPMTKRSVLIRMLNNLESHLFNRGEIDRGYQAVEFRLLLTRFAAVEAVP